MIKFFSGLFKRSPSKTIVMKGRPSSTCDRLGDTEKDPILLAILNTAISTGKPVIANIEDEGDDLVTEIKVIEN